MHAEVEDRSKQLQSLVNGLAGENMELKERIRKVEAEAVGVKKALEELLQGASEA